MMPKREKKSIRKAKKKLTRSIKRAHRKTSARKMKPVRNQSRTTGVLAVEVSEVEVIGDVEDVSGDGETEAITEDDLEEHFPPEYGGSE
jgi:hypothetical protein